MKSPESLVEGSAGRSAEQTAALIDAAHALLQERGLEGLTIRAVLDRSGLARRAFYDRFGGKDELVLAVFGALLARSAGEFEVRVAGIASPLDRLRFVIRAIVLGQSAENPGRGDRLGPAMSREHLRLAEARPAQLVEILRPLIGLIERLLAAAMATGEIRRSDPAALAELVYNLVSATAHAAMLGDEAGGSDRERRAELADRVWDFCRRALTG